MPELDEWESFYLIVGGHMIFLIKSGNQTLARHLDDRSR